MVVPRQTHRPHDDIVTLLEEALRALADADRVDGACRLAGRAHAALRRDHPYAARRFNVLLHRLTPRLPKEVRIFL